MELLLKVLLAYTTNIIEYIAEDQNINSDEITDITAISDGRNRRRFERNN